jgi:hypothetical protein
MDCISSKENKQFIQLYNALSNETFANLIDDFFVSSIDLNLAAKTIKEQGYYLIKKLNKEKNIWICAN